MSTATEQTNHTIKDSLLSHISSGLHEGKVIYREGFVGIVRLDEIRVTDRGFSATAVPITQIETDRYYQMPREPWAISTPWELIWESNGRFGVRYAVCSLLPAATLVRAVEHLLREDDTHGVLELIGLR